LLSKNVKNKVNKTIMLPVVLYGSKTLSFALREECRLRVFDNRMLRRILGPNRVKVTGDYRRLHQKKTEMGGACSMYLGEYRYVHGFSGET
jgi:hypothetical protein